MEPKVSLPCSKQSGHWILSSARWIQLTHSSLTSWRSILILYSLLFQICSTRLPPLGFPTKVSYSFAFSPMRAICPICLILKFFDLINIRDGWQGVRVPRTVVWESSTSLLSASVNIYTRFHRCLETIFFIFSVILTYLLQILTFLANSMKGELPKTINTFFRLFNIHVS